MVDLKNTEYVKRIPHDVTKGDGSKSVAACFINGQLVARGSTAFVASAMGISVNTLRRYRSHPVEGIKVIISPTIYVAYKGDKKLVGIASDLAKKIDATNKQICSAAARHHKCHGWTVEIVRVKPFSLPTDKIDEMRYDNRLNRIYGF